MGKEWQLPVDMVPAREKLGYANRFWFMGSCFAEALANRLEMRRMQVFRDPFGPLYNPLSIVRAVERIESGDLFTEDEVIDREGLYVSFWHHGSNARESLEAFLLHANKSLEEARLRWSDSDVAVISFGSAYVYERPEEGKGGHPGSRGVVANCHKYPESAFVRRRLGVDEITKEVLSVLERHPKKKWIFTVSPVRHRKDGAHGNQLSKSVLLLALDRICQACPRALYFPAYELLLDELRDYRFYAQDRCHPSEEAATYICDRFMECFFTEETLALADAFLSLETARAHRPLFPGSEAYKKFCKAQYTKVLALAARFPNENWSDDLNFWQKFDTK